MSPDPAGQKTLVNSQCFPQVVVELDLDGDDVLSSQEWSHVVVGDLEIQGNPSLQLRQRMASISGRSEIPCISRSTTTT